jgi:hypothetical protein
MIVENIQLGWNWPKRLTAITPAIAAEWQTSKLLLEIDRWLNTNCLFDPEIINLLPSAYRMGFFNRYYKMECPLFWQYLEEKLPDIALQIKNPQAYETLVKPVTVSPVYTPTAVKVPSLIEMLPSVKPVGSFFQQSITIPGTETEIPVLYLLIGGGALALFLLLRD